MRTLGLAMGMALLGGCGTLEGARMRLPPGLETAAAIPIDGVGGGSRGAFRAGAYHGAFERRSDEWSVGQPALRHARQHLRVAVEGPGIDGVLDVECDVSELALAHRDAEMVLDPRRVDCTFFDGGRRPGGGLRLDVAPPSGLSLEMAPVVSGEVVAGGVALALRSTNRLEGTAFVLESPAGYVFSDAGRPVGAADLAGDPAIVVAPEAGAEQRLPLVVASITLALLRD